MFCCKQNPFINLKFYSLDMDEEKKESTKIIEEAPKIDMDLYSRQIGVFGMETMGKLIKMKVFICGLRGVGLETAKNLILAGPQQVTLSDDCIITMNDLGSNFFATKEDIGKTKRSDCVYRQLKDLNHYVNVQVHYGPVNESAISEHDVIVVTDNYNGDQIKQLNEYCHLHKKGFIYGSALGLYSNCFVDFGDDHTIVDRDGEEC